MVRTIQLVSLLLVAVAMALSLAHALELPGKMRLDKDTYLAVQQIYYPGFTFGGAAEPVGTIALVSLLLFAAPAGTRFWWALAALAALIGMQLVYWFVTHPVNSVWTKDLQLSGFGAGFFSAFSSDVSGDWQRLRDVWDYSHVARAALGMLSFLCLTVAIMA
jgi:hypothetical protein